MSGAEEAALSVEYTATKETRDEEEQADATTVDGDTFAEGTPVDGEDATALVPAPAQLPTPQESLQELTVLCEYAASSGMFPSETFVSLLTKAMLGRQLGISAAAAFNGIHSIRGQPSISAELQRALAWRAGYRIRCLHSDRLRCALELVDAASGEVLGAAEFTAQEAQDAGLLRGGDSAWARWRSEMLYARATTRLISRFCPWILYGLTIND